MILSDWINIIRWKYFTNQKAGLIFKELMKEFRMVEQMTENKRFTSDIHRIYDDKEQIACADTMDDAEILVDLLNGQEEEIKSLKLENQLLLEEMKEIRDKLSIYLKIKGVDIDD